MPAASRPLEEAKNRGSVLEPPEGTQLCQLKIKSPHSNSPFIYSQGQSNSAFTFGEDADFWIMKTKKLLSVIDESRHDMGWWTPQETLYP